MKVLFVGSNPSTKNLDPKVPFKGTKSEKILLTWIEYLQINNYQFVNILDEPTPNNRALTYREIRESLAQFKIKLGNYEYDRIIALGISASKALRLLGIPHYRMAHPSPKNRALNDKKSLQESLKGAKVYLYESE